MILFIIYSNLSCCSVAKLCPNFCDSMDYRNPGFPVLHYLPEIAQTYVHWIDDTIQTSHALSSPSPPALSLSQHQGLFLLSQLFASGGQSVGASDSASVLPMNIQGWFLLELISFPLVWSPCCPRDSQESSPVPEFISIKSLALSLYGPTLIAVYDYWKTTVLPIQGFVSKGMFLLSNISV